MSLQNRPPLNEKQIAANQANSKLSTGPRSVAGKRNSSLNATTHGFLAQSILIPGESRTKFLKLLADLTTEFEPSTGDQHGLVQTMAIARWRTFRAWTIEAASLAYEHNRLAEANTNSGAPVYHDAPTQTMLAFRSLSQQPQNLDNLSRFEGRFDRQYHRAADRLLRLQEKMRERSRESADTRELTQ
jgi:hypothetical protein